jgi:hypothetical protein
MSNACTPSCRIKHHPCGTHEEYEGERQRAAHYDQLRRERLGAPMQFVEPCHEPCYIGAVVLLMATDARREEMIRDHFRRREEYRTVVVPRREMHRREWRQRYGTDPAPMSDRRNPEDDYACRYSGFTDQGAQQIRIREAMLRTGQAPIACLYDERMAS